MSIAEPPPLVAPGSRTAKQTAGVAKRKSLTVVTPVFNEEDVIARFYERTKAVLGDLAGRYDTKILFVLDRSNDGTLQILRELAARDPDAQVIALSSRFGHQMSLLAGIDHADDADVIVMMDSDLQHPPEIIPELLAAHEAGNDVVYTVRVENRDTGVVRRTLGSGFYRLLSYLSRVPIHENSADFRLISRRVAALLRKRIRERNMFLRGLFTWIGFNQARVDYAAAPRAGGHSKYSLARMLGLATAAILSFSTKPLQISIFLGLGFAAASLALVVFTVVAYFHDKTIPSGWTTIVTLLLLFSGVQLIVMGILGAYIGGIYEEVKERPHYIVDEIINLGDEES
ncbi:MAG TPA: glycosyltransferase family 2 protein [Casimicrobiaceae bacterium]|nr:glycosyltransferase family 2 protein [Casimicrobiaceae bacterium]